MFKKQKPKPKPPIQIMSKKISYHFGINDYKGSLNDLRGCVNDAVEWKNLYEKYGYSTNLYKDSEATKSEIKKALQTLVEASNKYGKDFKGSLTFSGHGTHTEDRNGDEVDGRDEAWVMYDGLFIDDDIRSVLDQIHPEAQISIISDSCHSGTVTRAFLGLMSTDDYVKPRYLPPEDDLEAGIDATTRSQLLAPKGIMNEVLLTGCNPAQYSYDAFLGGRYMGAMTFHATNILKDKGNISYQKLFELLRKELPSPNHPQTPQLEGKSENKDNLFF